MRSEKKRSVDMLWQAVACLVVAGCGGGSGGAGMAAPGTAGTTGESAGSAMSAQAYSAKVDDLVSTKLVWQQIAREGESFTLTTSTAVRYGAGTTWLEKRLPAGTAYCTNDFFGRDPLVTIVKSCQVAVIAQAQSPAPAPTPAPAPAPSGQPAPSPSPTPSPSPAPAGSLPAIGLLSPVGGSALPFTVGQTFRQGEVPAGMTVRADISRFQAVVKNRWPDGSAKIAILSGRADLSANAWKSIGLTLGSASTSTPLTTAELNAGGASVSIQFGSFGTASWHAGDWDAPVQNWVSGPEMSSWTYRKPIGGDAHLVAWLEVRAYQGGRIEILPWLENGYLRVAGPSAKSGTATVTIDGSTRFSQSLTLLNHQRAVLAGGTTLTHWIGTDPQLTPRADTSHLMATKLVPNYRGTVAATSGVYSRLPTSYIPLDQASYPSTMGATGYHPSIGLLPEWDVAYLTSAGDPRSFRGVVISGYAAGRYGVHYRDETTQRPIRFSSYPTLVLGGEGGVMGTGSSSTNSYTPGASGGTPPAYASSHHPSMGYLAYLLTGWHYFVEESQYVAATNFLKQPDSVRQAGKGILVSSAGANTTRGAAWAMRSLTQAATVTPDGDVLRDEFVGSIGENIAWYHNAYVTTPHNPLGLVAPYSNYNGSSSPWTSAIWMDDFFTAAYGFLKDTQSYPTAVSSKLDAFLMWKYKSVVGRLGGSGADQYSYRHAAQYTLNYAPTLTVNWATGVGPWYASWGEVARSMGLSTAADAGQPLESGYPTEATGYWGNLMPALSYAVDHGAPGALAGWNRVVAASNFGAQVAGYNDNPVWGVKPRSVGDASPTTPTPTTPTPAPGTPTPAPTPAPAPTPTPTPGPSSPTASATLRWNASPEPDVAGYRVYYGTASRTYQQARGAGIDVGMSPAFTVGGLAAASVYYFSVTAYDSAGNESPFSGEVTKTTSGAIEASTGSSKLAAR